MKKWKTIGMACLLGGMVACARLGQAGSPYILKKDMPHLADRSIPQVHKGYYLAQQDDGLLHILDSEGNEAGRTTYTHALWIEEDVLLRTSDGDSQSFDYATGRKKKEALEGIGGVDSNVLAYDPDSEKVRYTTTSDLLDPKGASWTDIPSDLFSSEAYIVYDLDDVAQGKLDGAYRIWNRQTGEVYGPLQNAVYHHQNDLFQNYGLSRFYAPVQGMYPVQTDDGFLVIDGGKMCGPFQDAFPVGNDAVFVRDGQTPFLFDESHPNGVRLPPNALDASATNKKTVLVRESDGWKLYTEPSDTL